MIITVYSKSNCPNCESAKALLQANSLEYEEKNAEDPVTWIELLRKYPDVRQMPQIFIDDQRVGGFAGLQAALKQLGITPSA